MKVRPLGRDMGIQEKVLYGGEFWSQHNTNLPLPLPNIPDGYSVGRFMDEIGVRQDKNLETFSRKFNCAAKKSPSTSRMNLERCGKGSILEVAESSLK